VLNKPGSLTDEEFQIIRRHPEIGEGMLRESGMTNEKVLDVVRHHHERMSGNGYPDRLPAEKITLLARMGAVTDVYDAITSNRPYKAGWDPAESLAKMASWKGHFDEEVLKAFIKSLGIYPTGSLVRLSSGRLAVVVEQNQARITRAEGEGVLLHQQRHAAAPAAARPRAARLHREDPRARTPRELALRKHRRAVARRRLN
jgi:HD-GYP domain-containing protein (c-di-GMP phosphodiesterase class II)